MASRQPNQSVAVAAAVKGAAPNSLPNAGSHRAASRPSPSLNASMEIDHALHRSIATVHPAHGVLGLIAPSSQLRPALAGPDPKQLRKECGPNWNAKEISALIEVMRRLQKIEYSCTDKRHLMVPDSSKWLSISEQVMRENRSTNPRDAHACKSKWNQLIPDYKCIVDFLARTGTNNLPYWSMSMFEKKSEGLPCCFPEDVFFSIHEWYCSKPTIQPLHTRDLMSVDDSNYNTATTSTNDTEEGGDTFLDEENDVLGTTFSGDTADRSGSMRSQLPFSRSSKSMTVPHMSMSSPSTTPLRHKRCVVPPGITPHLISSSDTSDVDVGGRAGSTGVRRKSISGHSVMAEATRATGHVMDVEMRTIAKAAREIERSKIDVQLKLFGETMEYSRERDRRLHQNACVVNENAKLSIQKQGHVVQCLVHIAHVLRAGLLQRHPLPSPASRIVTPSPLVPAVHVQSTPSESEMNGEAEEAPSMTPTASPTND